MNKTVLVISNMYPSNRSKTYGIFVKNQVEQLKERGIEVDLAVVKDPRVGKVFVLKKYFIWLLKIISILLFKGRKYDIVHAHYIFPSGLFALWFKRLYGTKVIVTSHGGDIDQMSKKSNFIFKQTKKILHKSNYVIAVGEELKREITHTFGVSQEKVMVLNMGVNRQIFSSKNKEEAKQSLHLNHNNFHILFVGNLIKQKGIIELLDAYKMLKDRYPFIQLHLIGSVSNETFKQKIDQKIVNEQINDVKIDLPKSQHELANWMAAADLFVLPSHIEGFGLVALEAMSAHTPVVGTKVGGLAHLLENNAGILVESKNASSLKEGMETVIVSDEKRKSLVEQGEIVAQENNQDLIINKLLDLYSRL